MRIWQRYVLGVLVLALGLVMFGPTGPSTPALADDNVRIDVPASGATVSGRVEIRGRATTADPSRFSFYRLYYGAGSDPATLRPIGPPGDKPVVDDVLGVWDTSPLSAGDYTLQITVYDTDDNTTTGTTVVSVVPAPTPTPLQNQPPLVVVTPGATPNDTDNTGSTPTPVPELPQLVPQIPQINVPPPDQSAPQAPPPPQQTGPDLQPIQINAPPAAAPLPPMDQSGPSAPPPAAVPTVDTGPASAPPPPDQINPVGPPPAPVVAPYEPPPPPPTIVPPTPFGLPL